MTLFLFLTVLVWIGADFAALVWLYFQVGFGPILLLLVGTALLGMVLFRWQMRRLWREFRDLGGSQKGYLAAEGLLLFCGVCMLIAPLPGLDCVGLALMLPTLRRFLARRLQNWIAKRFEPGPGSFVFQMGGVHLHGWPPPAYSEPVAGLDPNDPRTDLPAASSSELHGAQSDQDSIEEAEFRTVSSTE